MLPNLGRKDYVPVVTPPSTPNTPSQLTTKAKNVPPKKTGYTQPNAVPNEFIQALRLFFKLGPRYNFKYQENNMDVARTDLTVAQKELKSENLQNGEYFHVEKIVECVSQSRFRRW